MRAHMALLQDWPVEIAGPLDIAIFSAQAPTADRLSKFRELTRARDLIWLPTAETPRAWRVIESLLQQHPLPATVARFASKAAHARFQDWSHDRQWNRLVVDGVHAAGLFRRKTRWSWPSGVATLCVRPHNVVSELWDQAQALRKGPMRAVFARERRLMTQFQSALFEAADLISPVSVRDADRIGELHPRKKVIALPIGFDWPEKRPALPITVEPRILFVGRMDWPPNEECLTWFLREVWPGLHQRRPDLQLDLVGGFASKSLRRQIEACPGPVFAHGEVPDLAPYYMHASLCFIPIHSGSGTRVKAIEAARFGLSLVSTAKGIEGLPLTAGEDYLCAETPGDWIEALAGFSAAYAERFGKSIFERGRPHFDRQQIQLRWISKYLLPLSSSQESTL